MMRKLLVFVLAAILVITLSPPLARADAQGPPSPKTVYATDYHMWFSIRTAIIELLGGVPMIRPEEIRAARQEKWWGDPVPVGPLASRSEKR